MVGENEKPQIGRAAEDEYAWIYNEKV